jgi:hypothetical protein
MQNLSVRFHAHRAKVMRFALIAALATSVGLSGLTGCASSQPDHEASASQQVVAHFALSDCQQIDVNLYKCPAIDKPICNPDYSGEVECVRVGRRGGVYVKGSPME